MSTRRGRGNGKLAAQLEARDGRDYTAPVARQRPHLVPDAEPGVTTWAPPRDDDEPRSVDELYETRKQREAELAIRVGGLEARYVPPSPVGFTPTIWRCEVYPEYTLHLATLGVVAQFRSGSYTATSQAVDDALAKLKGKKPIRRFSGVNIYRCGLCDFVSVDEEEVSDHRTAAHDLSGIRATVED